jgi:hypothetical protein
MTRRLGHAAFSRRQLLARGAALALAASAERFGMGDALGQALGAPSLRKGISLGGPGALRVEGHPDDYRLWGNREYIRDVSGTRWVKLWVSWYDLQEELDAPPVGRAASWSHLNTAPAGQSWLRRLDGQVRAINDDRLGVILGLYHSYPTWSSGARGPERGGRSRPAEQKLPLDVSPEGPWAWFVAYLMARYRKGSRPNPVGPHDGSFTELTAGYDPLFGNPDGAAIDVIEICNEPNLLAWPQEGVVDVTAAMIRSATTLSAHWGATPVLAPATADHPDSSTPASRRMGATTWSDFTRGVLDALSGYRSPVPLRWSHHNYRDVRQGTARAEAVLEMLHAAGWQSDVAPLWLTEGGLHLGRRAGDPAARQFQAGAIERNFRRMMQVADVYLWTQHTISDKSDNEFRSGLRDDFVWGRGPGRVRPSWHAWRDLPGAPTP